MGSGAWNVDDYKSRVTANVRSAGTYFVDTAKAAVTGVYKLNDRLNLYGVGKRECRYSADHPAARGISIWLDVTGSMGAVCNAIQKNLATAHELVVGKGYLPDAQIKFGQIGDYYSDDAPLGCGQYESNNEMDKDLEAILIEGGGGGQNKESYEMGAYFDVYHTEHDAWDDGLKPYFIMIGDEKAYDVDKKAVKELLGETIEAGIPVAEIFAQLKEKYHVYFILPRGAAHGNSAEIKRFWIDTIGGDNIISLESPDQVSETIAAIIGINEGVVTSSDLQRDLLSVGVSRQTIDNVTKSIANVGHTAGGALTTSAVTTGKLPDADDKPTRIRL